MITAGYHGDGVTLCYKCSQRKAVVDAKLRARCGGSVRNDTETREFEAYLYQQSPLCSRCTVLVKGMSRDIGEKEVELQSSKAPQSKTCTLALIAVTLSLVTVLILVCIFHQSVTANFTILVALLQSYSSSLLSEVKALSRDVISRSYDVMTNSLNSTNIHSVLQIGEDFYPANVDGVIYSIVLLIQVTTIVLRQHHVTSIVLSLLSYTLYKFSHLAPGMYTLYYKVLRYCFLSLSVLLVFTKKTTVVTVSQRKNTPKPVIKVRRSPRKREPSPLNPTSALFSDDEDAKPTNKSAESAANQSFLLNSSANQSGVFGSRVTPPGTPLKDVSSKFDIMKISASPIKTPKLILSEGTPVRRHAACLKPARFSLDPATKPLNTSSEQTDPMEDVRPRFDSTCSNSEENTETEEQNIIEKEALPLKPIMLILILSVVTNYYLIINYVLVS